jgi:hypothetical protein
MAIQNRQEVSADIQAQAAVVGETEYKQLLDDDFAQSCVFRKDVATSQSETGSTATVDFDDVDYVTVNQDSAGITYTLNNVQQGEIKFLKINKTAGQSIAFNNANDSIPDARFIDDETELLYMIVNKDGTLEASLITQSIGTATETLRGIVEKATTAEAQAGTANKFIDAERLQDVTATTTRLGIVEKATTAEAQAGTADKFIDASLIQDVFDNWQSEAYNAANYTNWVGSSSNFSLRYQVVGKTVFLDMSIQGTADGTNTILQYDLPSAINNPQLIFATLSVRAFDGTSLITDVAAYVWNATNRLTFERASNFGASTWNFHVSGSYEIQ